jgi:hypothetical protein
MNGQLRVVGSVALAFLLVLVGSAFGQAISGATDATTPQIRKDGGRYQFYVDNKPFFMMGGQVGNQTHLPEQYTAAWGIYKAYGANTLEFPVYWSDVEPQEGKYDFSGLQTIIRQAQQNGLHLIPVWFGAWKGQSNRYIPQWVLDDKTRFPRPTFADGTENQAISVLSPHGEATLKADTKVFTEMLKAIKAIDGEKHSVILVQVENEPGILGPVRDHAPAVNKLFEGQVPADLVKALGKQPGTWTQVFGQRFAEEAFTTYYMARYIDTVAAGGKSAYPLPMYINVWMGGEGTNDRFNDFDYPGSSYPSGGGQSHTLDIWRAAAKNIDLVAPDIYQHSVQVYRKILASYARPDNPLLIVETGRGLDFARYCFMAIGDFGAIGFAQFGIGSAPGGGRGARGPATAPQADAAPQPAARGAGSTTQPGGVPAQFADVAANFKLLRQAMPVILNLRGTPKLKSSIEQEFIPGQMLQFDGYDVHVMFPPALQARVGQAFQPQTDTTRPMTGRLLIGQTGQDEFVILGFDAAVDFAPALGSGPKAAKAVSIEQGEYVDGNWKASQTVQITAQNPNRVMLPADGGVFRVRLTRQ